MPKTKNKTRKTKKIKGLKLTTTRPLAPEDLRVGDGVAVARVTVQVMACDDPPAGQTHNRVLKADFIPRDAGDPLRVVGVCLPFVLAVNAARQHVTLDVRRQHLVHLDPAYTRCAFKKLGDKRSRSLR
ncbi:MAG: hypothetical protein AAF086_06985 [Planctomycetota bacterium]